MENTGVGRVALSPTGDALMSGSFFGTNVVFGPVLARASTLSGFAAFLARLESPAAPASPPIQAGISGGILRLSWPSGRWILERVDALGGSFSTFAYTATTNPVDGSVTVDIPLKGLGGFFRLRALNPFDKGPPAARRCGAPAQISGRVARK